MAKSNKLNRARIEDFSVNPEDRPGWVRGNERTPQIGEQVYCAAGLGVILSIHGKTGDGSRLVQIRLEDPQAPPFFAAGSNVLVSPKPVLTISAG